MIPVLTSGPLQMPCRWDFGVREGIFFSEFTCKLHVCVCDCFFFAGEKLYGFTLISTLFSRNDFLRNNSDIYLYRNNNDCAINRDNQHRNNKNDCAINRDNHNDDWANNRDNQHRNNGSHVLQYNANNRYERKMFFFCSIISQTKSHAWRSLKWHVKAFSLHEGKNKENLFYLYRILMIVIFFSNNDIHFYKSRSYKYMWHMW